MAGAPYILARNYAEAHTFASDELGVGRGYYRVVTSPSSIKGPRDADLYVLPGWEVRMDRFAMKTAMKFTRLNVIDVEVWRAEQAEVPASEPDGLSPAGEQITIEDADGMLTAMGRRDPEIAALVAEPTAAEAEEPKRRRRRCTECGALVEPDELEQHLSEHLPSEV